MTTAALTASGDCTLVARPHPFDPDKRSRRGRPGSATASAVSHKMRRAHG